MKQKILYLLLLLISSQSSHAVLTYDESINGDIFSVTLFNLGIGINTVSGSTQFSAEPEFWAWGDSELDNEHFSIYIPANTVLASMTIDMQLGYFDSNYNLATVEFDTGLTCSTDFSNENSAACNNAHGYGSTNSSSYQYDHSTQIFSTTYDNYNSLSNLAGDTYYQLWLPNSYGGPLPSGLEHYAYGAFDYTITLEVAGAPEPPPPPPPEVPVPAAFWLFGSGLIGLIGMAKRKSA